MQCSNNNDEAASRTFWKQNWFCIVTLPYYSSLASSVVYIILLLQKVIRRSGTLVPIFVSRCWVELWKFAMIVNSVLRSLIHGIVDLHNCGLISTSVTIVGGRENGNDLSIVLPLIAFHDKLVGTWNEMKAINVSKLLGNVLSEGVPGSPRWDTPSTSFGV